MKRNALLMLVCCLVMGAVALVAAPSQAMAMPYHATDSELDTSKVTYMDKMFDDCRSLNKLTVGDKFVIN